MPKRLFVMRHAKSSWDHPGLTDHQRPLNARGMRTAPQMAKFLDGQKTIPNLLLTSSAVRAATTATLLQTNLKPQPELKTCDEFYLAPAETYINKIRQCKSEHSQIMVIGHNPGLEDLVQQLAGQHHRMPTATIAVFDFLEENWKSIAAPQTKLSLIHVWRPKEIDLIP